jgi:hypothetical protein
MTAEMSDDVMNLMPSIDEPWPDRVNGPWQLRVQFEATPSGIRCVEFHLHALPGTTDSVTARLLRQVPLGLRGRKLAREWAADLRHWSSANESVAQQFDRALAANKRQTVDYARVAELHNAARRQGLPVTVNVADGMGVDEAHAAVLIYRARKRDYNLEPAQRPAGATKRRRQKR